MKTVKSNEIKKGTRMVLSNGFAATMYDNRKGNVRMAEVQGYCTEIGSIYVWDIALVEIGGETCARSVQVAQWRG